MRKSDLIQYSFNYAQTLYNETCYRKQYKPIRGKIEDFFKLCKSGLSLKKLHKYTPESAKRTTILTVFLVGFITIQGHKTKTALQKLSET